MLSNNDLIYFKKKLLQMKREVIQDLEDKQPLTFEDSGELTSFDNHFADHATELDEREKQLTLNDTSKSLLEDIDEALGRIQNGTYGICVDTGEEISYDRLQSIPYAKRTLEAQERFEKEKNSSDQIDRSFFTPDENSVQDNRIRTVDKLQHEHGNSSY